MPRFLNQVVDEYNETCNKFLSIVGDVCHTMYAASKQSKIPTNHIADEPMFRWEVPLDDGMMVVMECTSYRTKALKHFIVKVNDNDQIIIKYNTVNRYCVIRQEAGKNPGRSMRINQVDQFDFAFITETVVKTHRAYRKKGIVLLHDEGRKLVELSNILTNLVYTRIDL